MAGIAVIEGARAEAWIRAKAEPGTDAEARRAVEPILADVRARGDVALRELTQRFEGVPVSSVRVPREAGRRALRSLSAERRSALEAARQNLEAFHRAQLREEPRVDVRPGVTVWREFRPNQRIGIYVPGGRAGYPSTLLMCAVPARLAGCADIVVCVPPSCDGQPPESVLAVAELLRIETVCAVGGAQAVAALAFGTESVPRVDKIFGPGNRYVTAAKELVYGVVDIDLPAGPTEIVVLADDSANPRWLAADLISQAEHAPDVLAVCVTTSETLGHRVADEIELQLEALPEPSVSRESLSASAVCIAPDAETAVEWVNALAPEHLTIVTRDDGAALERIIHAGSVFLGPYSATAAGDYATGSNHVLPTAGRARAWSALSVDDFGRWVQVQRLTVEGLAALAETVTTLSRWEGFEAHARAVEARFEEAP